MGRTAEPQAGRVPTPVRTAVFIVVLLIGGLLALTVGRPDGGGAVATTASYDVESGRLSFRLQSFDGEAVNSEDLLGTPVVLNGYASWCTVCRREMPDVERVHRAAAGKVVVLGFNPQSNDTDDAQARLVRVTGVTYQTLRDPGDELLRLFSPNGGLPVTLFVDADGVVRKVHRGLLTEQMLLDEIRRSLGVEV